MADFRGCHIVLGALLAVFVLITGIPTLGTAQAQTVTTPRAEDDLSLASVLRRAYENNPALNAARAEFRAVQEKLPQAYANFKPVVAASAAIVHADIDGNEFGGSGLGGASGIGGAAGSGYGSARSMDGTTSKDVALTLQQPLYRGGRSMAQLSAVRHVIAAQEALLRQKEQDILLESARNFLDVLRDQAVLELVENNQIIISGRLRETTARYEAGELTLTDVAQAKARMAAGEANLVAARGALRSSLANFEKVNGFIPRRALPKPLLNLPPPASLEQATEFAKTLSPILLAADYAARASQDDIDRVFGELLPEIGFTAEWSRSFDPQPGGMPDQESKTLAVQARIPLYQGGAVRSRLREAKEVSEQRRLEHEDTAQRIRQNVTIGWEDYQASMAEIQAREAQIEAASLARRGVSAEELAGMRTVLDALDAEQEYLQAQVDLIRAERNEMVARFSLAAIYADLTPENLWLAGGGAPLTGSHLDLVRDSILDHGRESVYELDFDAHDESRAEKSE